MIEYADKRRQRELDILNKDMNKSRTVKDPQGRGVLYTSDDMRAQEAINKAAAERLKEGGSGTPKKNEVREK